MSAAAQKIVVPVGDDAPRRVVTKRRVAAALGLVERCATERELRYRPIRTDPRLGRRQLPRRLTRCERAVDGLLQTALADGFDGARVTVGWMAWRADFSERAVHYALRALGPCCAAGDGCAIPGHTARGRRLCSPCVTGCERHLGIWQRVPQFEVPSEPWVTRDGVAGYRRRQTASCITTARRGPVRAQRRHANANANATRTRHGNANANASRPGLRAVGHGCNDCTPTSPPSPKGKGEGQREEGRRKESPSGTGEAFRSPAASSLQATQATAVTAPAATRSLAPDGEQLGGRSRRKDPAAELAAAALAAQAALGAAAAVRAEREAALLKARLDREERARRSADEIRAELDPELADILAEYDRRHGGDA